MAQQEPDVVELDFSASSSDDFEALSHDTVPVRSLVPGDLDALVRIDHKITGRDRRPYYIRKLAETLDESGIRLSLVAEIDDHPVGFVMANVDYGEFGVTQREAVIHTIGVDPDYAHRHVGTALLSQLLANLATLRVDTVMTEVDWNGRETSGLLAFLRHCGFVPSPRISLSREVS
ncbi:MAG: GNAT family N-acetyltransferase [Alphaproteobacteria bacterium]|nr:GNAT family N-acetyltransferase [Alphaproteobacteria bacterium]